jgi:hypothetical protein
MRRRPLDVGGSGSKLFTQGIDGAALFCPILLNDAAEVHRIHRAQGASWRDFPSGNDGQSPTRSLYDGRAKEAKVTLLEILSYVAVAVVLVVLLWGLYNLMRGGSANLSQKLMRARIVAQLIAIIVVMTLLYFIQRSASAG